MATKLFTQLRLRDMVAKNRVWVSPMCQYSAEDGIPSAWHLVHLGGRAVGGAGVVIAEATAVVPEGRISPGCTGLWSDAHTAAWAPIAAFISSQGAVPGIQLAHAGRKASCALPWLPSAGAQLPLTEGGWQTVGPSPTAFRADGSERPPREMTAADFAHVTSAFVAAAHRAVAAGFKLIELHAAHGYLLHECMSPASNTRTDEFGGDLDGRLRWPLEVVAAVRAALPPGVPLVVRISATDWAPDGRPAWDVPQSVELCKRLKAAGVDLVDVSSGGNLVDAAMKFGPGYQVPFAEAIRAGADIPVGAVGLITDPHQAAAIVDEGRADVVLLARELLRDPYWPLHAARVLGVDVPWPPQYVRSKAAPPSATR